MNLAWTVVIVMAVGWTLVSILVALAFGGMASGRDVTHADGIRIDTITGATGVTDLTARAAAPSRDDEFRTAV